MRISFVVPFLLCCIQYFVECIQFGIDVTDKTKYPFFITIGSPHVCGGAIVSYDPALVLTAAHCMDVPMQQFESPFFVLYNDVERSKLVTVPIEDWTIHPNYNASGMINIKYDTAILRLKRPLIESAHVKRAVFWPPTAPLSTPLRGEMVGFGYVDSEGQLAKTLQFLPLEVTRFDAYNYIEARSDTETVVACHGDSGGPLIVPQSIQNPYTNGTVTVPFVMGTLTRILGARDISPDKLTCPVPSDQSVTHSSAAQNTVVEAFTNAPSMLDWISSVSGISVANLTDPFYNLPALPCSADCQYDTTGSNLKENFIELSITDMNGKQIDAAADTLNPLNTNDSQQLYISSTPKSLLMYKKKNVSNSQASVYQISISLFLGGILIILFHS